MAARPGGRGLLAGVWNSPPRAGGDLAFKFYSRIRLHLQGQPCRSWPTTRRLWRPCHPTNRSTHRPTRLRQHLRSRRRSVRIMSGTSTEFILMTNPVDIPAMLSCSMGHPSTISRKRAWSDPRRFGPTLNAYLSHLHQQHVYLPIALSYSIPHRPHFALPSSSIWTRQTDSKREGIFQTAVVDASIARSASSDRWIGLMIGWFFDLPVLS